MPSIRITVPANRNNRGTLAVLDAAGREVVSCVCLAKAAQELASKVGNSKRDPVKRYGDTPVGSYIAQKGAVALDPPQKSFGAGWIPLDPVGGQAQTAEDRGRSGLAIHGGRGNTRLVPTGGCIRVFDRDYARIVAALRGAKGFKVEVTEV